MPIARRRHSITAFFVLIGVVVNDVSNLSDFFRTQLSSSTSHRLPSPPMTSHVQLHSLTCPNVQALRTDLFVAMVTGKSFRASSSAPKGGGDTNTFLSSDRRKVQVVGVVEPQTASEAPSTRVLPPTRRDSLATIRCADNTRSEQTHVPANTLPTHPFET